MKRSSIWTNSDGLYVGFGPRAKEVNTAAVIGAGDGQTRTAILKIVGADLPLVSGAKEIANSVIIPAGANIKSVRVVVGTQFATGTSIDLGGFLASTDVVDNETGFIAALLLATLVTGYDETYVAPATNKGGAYIGTQLAAAVKIGASYNTTAFTAGTATVTIEYEVPAN